MRFTTYLYSFIFIVFTGLCACQATPQPKDVQEGKMVIDTYFNLEGQTMGTVYHITYEDSLLRNFKTIIDSVLVEINKEVNTYDPTSVISEFNRGNEALKLAKNALSLSTFLRGELIGGIPHPHFLRNYLGAKNVYRLTDGNFDPTVMPLVQYWGFGTEKRAVTAVDSQRVDSLKQYIGYDKLVIDRTGVIHLRKSAQGVQLDFSASAKGYGVDQLSELLEERGVLNFFVEIGGEVRAKGKSKRGDWWRAGINRPKLSGSIGDFVETMDLRNIALASSGNYRNFYEVDGQFYGHTINPKTGYPELSDLLGVSVLTNTCQAADAFATAFMVMGVEPAYEFASKTDGVDVFLVYSEKDGRLASKYTNGFAAVLRDQEVETSE